jgi:hypothetical protein
VAAEITFLALLSLALLIATLVGASTVARVVEPRGLRVLLRRLAGKG